MEQKPTDVSKHLDISSAPPPPSFLYPILQWLETNVRKPLEGSTFDKVVATPAKKFYTQTRKLD
jgi:hypothetical protein